MTPYQRNFSLIIPTYKEVDNLSELAQRIAQIDFGRHLFEVIIVDDNSQDGTMEKVCALQQQYPWLKLLVRQQNKGLSASVIAGFQRASYPLLIVMDADLSHPPETIPAMLNKLMEANVDMVIGSRYIIGGSTDQSWQIVRKIVSQSAAMIARICIHTKISDPLSGFFAIKKDKYLSGNHIKTIGWKIGLELIVKCHCQQIVELPIHFAQRYKGKSKISLKIMFHYLRQVSQLMIYMMVKRHFPDYHPE